MTSKECDVFLETVVEFGRRLIATGCEAKRVEDTLTRICNAYGFEDNEVYAVTSHIVITIKGPDDMHYTQSARVFESGTDLGRLEELNAKSRYICENKPTVEEFRHLIRSYKKPKSNRLVKILGYMLAAGGFAVFFGGRLVDGIASAIVAVLIYFMDCFMKPKMQNSVIYTFVASFISGCFCISIFLLGLGHDVDKIMIGDVMLLIPGLLLVNSIKEMFNSDILTGLYKFVDSVFIAVAIGGGFALSYIALGGVL